MWWRNLLKVILSVLPEIILMIAKKFSEGTNKIVDGAQEKKISRKEGKVETKRNADPFAGPGNGPRGGDGK